MPVINAKVLTTTDQGLTELQKETARKNIDAIRKVDGVEGNIVTVGRDGEVQDSQVSIHVFRDVQADWADEAPDSPHHIKNKPEQLLADARVENDVLVIDKLYGGETVEFSGMTEAEREKLGGIAEGAQVNVIEDVQVAGDSLVVTGKAVNVPYAGASVNGVVKLTDDPDSVTENTAASPAAIRAALANFGGFMVVGLTDDPEPVPCVQDPSPKYIYLTKDEHSSEKDPYTEWIYVVPEQGEPHWDVIGEASVDLSGYVEKVPSGTQGNITMLASDGGIADSAIAATGVADAVDKKHSHSNKATLDLVEEPYTTSEKTKLAGMEDFVESFVAPAYDPDRTAYYPGEICVYDDKCYRAKNIIMNGGSAIGEFDPSRWAETNFADSRMQILNWWVTAGGAPSSEVTKKAVESGQLVGIRYVTPASPTNYQIKNTIFWLDHYYTDTAGNVIAKFVHTELTIYSEPQYEPYNGITYSIKNFLSSGDPCWTEESHDYKFYTAAEQHKLSGIAEGAQVNAIERITANSTPLNISNKAVDIPLATSEADGLLPHGKFPLIPPAPSLADGPDQVYSFDNDDRMSWQAIVKDYVGDMVLDQSGLPVEGEDGSPVFSEGSIRLWLSYKGTEFGARRAYDDHTGANIHDSIEARTTMAQVTAAIEAALANYGGFKLVDKLVDGHPDVQDPSERFIYLYKDPEGPEADPYTEWIYTSGGNWDVIGTTYIDVSNFTHRVGNATGNLPKLKSDGDLDDSGVAASDVATAVQNSHSHSNKSVLDEIPARSGTDAAMLYSADDNSNITWKNWNYVTVSKKTTNSVLIGKNWYPYVKIGNLYWTAENLREPIGTKDTDYWIYDDNTLVERGYIYSHSAVLDGVQGVESAALLAMLHDGWHIPTREEAQNLLQRGEYWESGGYRYFATDAERVSNTQYGLTLTDAFGFRGYTSGWYRPSGHYSPYYQDGYTEMNNGAYYYTKTAFDSQNVYAFGIWYSNGTGRTVGTSLKAGGETYMYCCVRLCKSAT